MHQATQKQNCRTWIKKPTYLLAQADDSDCKYCQPNADSQRDDDHQRHACNEQQINDQPLSHDTTHFIEISHTTTF